jgi:hypothetical protein
MNETKSKRGGARKGAGRKKGIGMAYDIQKACENFIVELLKDDAIKNKALRQVEQKISKEIEDESYLYIIKDGSRYKIGHSYDYKKRMKNFSTYLPNFETVYLSRHKKAFEMEERLHKEFENCKIEGEWFELDSEHILIASKICSDIIVKFM